MNDGSNDVVGILPNNVIQFRKPEPVAPEPTPDTDECVQRVRRLTVELEQANNVFVVAMGEFKLAEARANALAVELGGAKYLLLKSLGLES